MDSKRSIRRSRKLRWTPEEDAELLQAVRSQAVGELPDPEDIEWSIVKSKLPQRSGAQLRDRYANVLNPKANRSPLTTQEMEKLLELQSGFGNKWKFIAKHFPGRTALLLKNAYFSLLRRFTREHDCEPRGLDLLKFYMNSDALQGRKRRKRANDDLVDVSESPEAEDILLPKQRKMELPVAANSADLFTEIMNANSTVRKDGDLQELKHSPDSAAAILSRTGMKLDRFAQHQPGFGSAPKNSRTPRFTDVSDEYNLDMWNTAELPSRSSYQAVTTLSATNEAPFKGYSHLPNRHPVPVSRSFSAPVDELSPMNETEDLDFKYDTHSLRVPVSFNNNQSDSDLRAPFHEQDRSLSLALEAIGKTCERSNSDEWDSQHFDELYRQDSAGIDLDSYSLTFPGFFSSNYEEVPD